MITLRDFIELLKVLSPLEAVATWRRENTRRQRQWQEFSLELLDRMSPEQRDQHAASALELIPSRRSGTTAAVEPRSGMAKTSGVGEQGERFVLFLSSPRASGELSTPIEGEEK
ncbi:MAG: hypothetical protein M3256_19370 [Actinomycetota bacterium]|nr:hypothetical protein [Actinomycetota bacterium]